MAQSKQKRIAKRNSNNTKNKALKKACPKTVAQPSPATYSSSLLQRFTYFLTVLIALIAIFANYTLFLNIFKSTDKELVSTFRAENITRIFTSANSEVIIVKDFFPLELAKRWR